MKTPHIETYTSRAGMTLFVETDQVVNIPLTLLTKKNKRKCLEAKTNGWFYEEVKDRK